MKKEKKNKKKIYSYHVGYICFDIQTKVGRKKKEEKLEAFDVEFCGNSSFSIFSTFFCFCACMILFVY